MTLSGVYLAFHFADLFVRFAVVPIELLLIPMIVVGGPLMLGILLLVASGSFARLAANRGVAALTRGFSVLTVIYMLQAIAMLLAIGLVATIWLLSLI